VIIYHKPGGGTDQSPTPTGLGYTPAQLKHAYGLDQIKGDGTGQTIAIVDAFDNPGLVSSTAANFNTSDLHQFDVGLGLPDPPSFVKVAQDGSTNYPPADPTGGWETEEDLDVEWAHALAPGANILLVEANSAADTDLIQAAVPFAAAQPGVSVVSMSFGRTESAGDPALNSLFTTPSGHQGITFLAATGDHGEVTSTPADPP
jgi:subtilase family serine protease